MKRNITIFISCTVFIYLLMLAIYALFLSKSIGPQHGVIIISFMTLLTICICYGIYRYVALSIEVQNVTYAKTKEILESVNEISDSILTIENTQQLFQLILEKAVKCIDDAQMGSLLILNNCDELEFKAMVGYDFEKFKNVNILLEDCFLYKYNHGDTSKACIIRNIEEFDKKNLDEETYKKLHKADAFITKTAISAPIKVDNKFYGIINVDSEKSDGFTDIDLSFMEYFANQISTVIKNHDLLEKMLYLLRHDNLTGIYNRYYFEELFEATFDRAARYNESFSLVMFDLNNLKMTNDTFGHQTGDRLIQQFAEGLKMKCRKTDIAARVGGDEFVAVYLYADYKDVECIINNLNKHFLSNPLCVHDMCITIQFSYGIAHFPSDGKDMKTLLKVADDKMYLYKDKYKFQ